MGAGNMPGSMRVYRDQSGDAHRSKTEFRGQVSPIVTTLDTRDGNGDGAGAICAGRACCGAQLLGTCARYRARTLAIAKAWASTNYPPPARVAIGRQTGSNRTAD